MRISNLVSTAHLFNHHINLWVLPQLTQSAFVVPETEFNILLAELNQTLQKTQALCHKMNGKPEDLPTPSFRAYQWLKFLAQPDWALAHTLALNDFYRQLSPLFPNLNINKISQSLDLEIYHSAYLFRSRQKERKVYLEINEGFINAPAEVKQTILEAAVKRRTTKRLNVIKSYASRPDYQAITSALQANNGANQLAGRGRCYDLSTIYQKVNLHYFNASLEQPRLMWSSRKTTRRLGSYHPESDTITINLRLDSTDIPPYLVEYVMYHEMLHKKIGLKEINGRRYAHTKTFRDAEQKFEYYKEAEEFIKRLNQLKWI